MKPKSNTFLLLSGVFGSIVSVLVLLGLVLSMIGLSAVPSIIDQFQESFISPAYGATAGHGTTVCSRWLRSSLPGLGRPRY